MRDAPPTRRDVMLAGVLPTLAALLVATVILIERLQIDWTQFHVRFLPKAWLPFLVAFGLAHIAGAPRNAPSTSQQKASRLGKGIAFLLLHTPFTAISFGAYFFFLQSAPVFALLMLSNMDPSLAPQPYEQTFLYQAFMWQLIGLTYALPGVAFGLFLAVAAWPPWGSLARADRRRLNIAYGLGGAAASAIFIWSIGAVDNDKNSFFTAEYAWLDALAIYAATILCCGAVWMAALQGYWRSGFIARSLECWRGFGILTLLALTLAGATHLAVGNGLTVFGENADRLNPVANFVRDGQPTLSEGVTFHGARFTGPRSVLAARDQRGEYMIFRTSLWSPPHGTTDIRLEPHALFSQRPPNCLEVTATRTICADLGKVNAGPQFRSTNLQIFEYDAAIPSAVVTHWVLTPENTPATLEQLKSKRGPGCSVELAGVPANGVYAITSIACSDDWPADALRLKSMLDSWFVRESK